ncbi:hypothetical protein [Haloprofundus salinisoli]|uniref:hypothetical protein n=1 Tax=Haloprofundus salinisoli TaxID=2876193 RepID=UPI001CC97F5C|nr:hypothetical protein [Haloprofundus salinisoli]
MRKAYHGEIDANPEYRIRVVERTLVETAQLLSTDNVDTKRFLEVLQVPVPELGVEVRDIYPESDIQKISDDAFEPISLEDVEWLESFCNAGLQSLQFLPERERLEIESAIRNQKHATVEGAASFDEEAKPDKKTRRNLRIYGHLFALKLFCRNALELGVRPDMIRN